MKIAIAGIRGIPARYGGFETSAEETAKRLSSLGHEVTVYCRPNRLEPQEDEVDGIKLVVLKTYGPKSLETIFHSIAVALHIVFRTRNVDVVHMYNAASAFGGLIIRMSGKPLLMTLDGVEWRREKWGGVAKIVWKIATWLATRVATARVCDSQTVQSFLQERYETSIDYIPYGSNCIEEASDAYKTFGLEASKYFLFVGRLVPEKGVDTLLDAYNELNTDLPLVIVGDNENNPAYVESLRQRAGENVKFLGYRYGEVYESLLLHSRAYVSASKLEGTSPSLLAAMGASICCLVNGIPENRETGSNAILYFDGSAQDLCQKLQMLIDDSEIVNEYRRKGRERVLNYYCWDAVTRQYLTSYRAIARDRRFRLQEV